jgi:hypothetical protein
VADQPTPTDQWFAVRFPDTCCAEVSRNGESQPCDKTAVAVADGDEESYQWWPVCPHHSRGRKMVPLSRLLEVLGG